MTIQDLYDKYKDEPKDGGKGFHTWQIRIFQRIENLIKNDKEALTIFKYIVDYADRKSRCVVD